MKTVLIIAHLAQATPRIPGLVKYLPEFGWSPIILTGPMAEKLNAPCRIIETPYSETLGFCKRLLKIKPAENPRAQIKKQIGITSKNHVIDFVLTRIGEIVNYPDSEKGWKQVAIKIGSELLQKEHIDAIISSSSPVTSHIIAKELKTKYKVPWVADLRDLWSQNHGYYYSWFRKLIDRRLELKTLSEADALITVSQPWAEKLNILHKGKPVYVITHGFDPVEVNIPPVSLTPKFTITYTGTIYAGKQDPSRLFTAIKDLVSCGTINPDDIEVRFYGQETEWLFGEVEKFELQNVVKPRGLVNRQVAITKQRESQILLALNWEGKEQAGYSLKLFEYLAAQRPILATGPGNDMTPELLEETRAGWYAPTIADIKNVLMSAYSEFKLNGKVSYQGNREKVSKYTYQEMAKQFAEILNEISIKYIRD